MDTWQTLLDRDLTRIDELQKRYNELIGIRNDYTTKEVTPALSAFARILKGRNREAEAWRSKPDIATVAVGPSNAPHFVYTVTARIENGTVIPYWEVEVRNTIEDDLEARDQGYYYDVNHPNDNERRKTHANLSSDSIAAHLSDTYAIWVKDWFSDYLE